MKKLFSLCLLLCLWLPLCAFTSATTGTVMYGSGATIEVVSIKYTEADALALGQTFAKLDAKMKSIVELEEIAVKAKLLEVLSTMQDINVQETAQKISVDVGVLDGQNFGTFSVVITYETKEVWNLFQKPVQDKTKSTLEESLFIKKYTTVSPVRLAVFDVLGQKQNVCQFVLGDVKTKLVSTFGSVENIFDGTYQYTFASTAVRLHTDAQTVEASPSSSLVYYTWTFDDTEEAYITIWQLRPNATAWYVLALGLTGVFGVGLWIASKKKPQKITDENA